MQKAKKKTAAALVDGALLRQSGETLADVLQRQLEQAILKGEFKPGDRLDEVEVARRYGVSRTPVREAFRLLGANDLVDVRSRQGVIVRKVGVNTVIEMFQVLAELEGLCARLASRRMSPEQDAEMGRIHERLKSSAGGSDVDEFDEINLAFHSLIHEASRNAYLAQETRRLRNRMAPYLRRVTYKPHRFRTTVTEHQAIIDAIRTHLPDKADEVMRQHVSLLSEDLADFIAVYD